MTVHVSQNLQNRILKWVKFTLYIIPYFLKNKEQTPSRHLLYFILSQKLIKYVMTCPGFPVKIEFGWKFDAAEVTLRLSLFMFIIIIPNYIVWKYFISLLFFLFFYNWLSFSGDLSCIHI